MTGRVVYESDFGVDPIGTSPPSGWTTGGGSSGAAHGTFTVAAWPDGGQCGAIAMNHTGGAGSGQWFYAGQGPALGNIGPAFDVAPGVPLAIDVVANVQALTAGLTFRVQMAWFTDTGAAAGFATPLNTPVLGPLATTVYPVPPANAVRAATRVGVEGNQPGPGSALVASIAVRRLDLAPLPPEPSEPACMRRAWLTLPDGRTMPLEDEAKGYFCSSLDLGYPEVREVTNPRPDASGTDDRTEFYSSRVVTAAVSAHRGAGAVIDEVYASFAPFLALGAGAELHYVLERAGAPERVVTAMRPASFAGPIAGPFQRDMQLQWVASDPVIYDVTEQRAESAAGSGAGGRKYDLIFPRDYTLEGVGPTVGMIRSNGDVGVFPIIRIYGPITAPVVTFTTYHENGTADDLFTLPFLASFTIDAAQYLEIDTANKRATYSGDPDAAMARFIDWFALEWPYLPPMPQWSVMALTGQRTGDVTQAVATWRDGFLL